MATNELAKLASAVQRQTTADGVYDTAVPGLTLYRSSAPSDHDAVVDEPCLVIVAQGSKEVLLGGERCRHDPAQSLLVSLDLPVAGRVVEASPARLYLAVRIALDPAVGRRRSGDSAGTPVSGTPLAARP